MHCSTCGTPLGYDTRFCGNCGTSRVTVATLLQSTPSLDGVPRIASLGRRVLAAVLDFIAIWSVIAAIVVMVPSDLLKDGFQGNYPAALIPIGLCMIALTYYVALETLFGATPGKGIAGIQVRLRDYGACDLRASTIRNLLRLVDAFAAYLVGFVVAILSQSRQRIGDLAAGTIVVLRPSSAKMRVLLSLLWFVLAGTGFVAYTVVPRH